MLKKILIVDDNAINRLMLANMLKSDYELLQAVNGREALDIILRERGALSAVLLDIVMPELDGYEVLRRVRDSVGLSDLPIIMVTGSEEEESRSKALTLGADDFILKPYNPDVVKHCVRNNIVLYETALKLNAIQKDKLTGLYTREAFFDKVSELIAAHEPGYYLLSCFDVDNFKLINDRFGTAEGDSILRGIGKSVTKMLDGCEGIGARISGDNFAVLLPAERQSLTILNSSPEDEIFSSKLLSFSVGRYLINDLSLPASSIYDRASIAKQSVKGRYDKHVAYFTPSMLEQLVRSQSIASEAEAALSGRQFEVWYQPQLNHSTGALSGTEALVRWRHPEKGLIAPGEFIPLFEQNGFIYELDRYVWEEVCSQLRRWTDEGRSPVPVSVNISRHDVFRPDFTDTLAGLISKYSLSAEQLRLEITESTFSQSTDTMVDIVRRLIDMGFTIEIDDFGSGYSSLNTLKSVPAQVVKLDMRFLEDDSFAERGGNILGSVVRMAKWLGMSVIAEGVEEKAQADYLASIGCSYMQGYYYARPMPAVAYEKYCRAVGREHHMLSLNTVENLDNNTFWDPKSMDTLIFSSYVGGACIFEYCRGNIELLRANRKFAAIFGSDMSVEDTLKLDWLSCLAPESRELVRSVLRRSVETKDEYTNEYLFLNIPGAPEKTYLRGTMRVIATSGELWLVYCTSENITAQREAEQKLLETDEQLRFLNSMSHELLAQPDTDLGINAALKRLLTYFSGTRAYIFETDTRRQLVSNTYEVCGEGVSSEMASLQDLPLSILDCWLAAFDKDGFCVIGDVSSLDDSRAEERKTLEAQNISSLFAVPLRRDGKFIGMMGVDDPRRALVHTDRLIALGDYIAVMLTRRDLDRRISKDNRDLSTMMNDMPGGFVRMRLTSDGTLIPFYFNDGFSKLTGMDRDELRELYLDDILNGIHPDDRAAVTDAVRQMLSTGRANSSSYRIRHKTGAFIWVATFGRITKELSGETVLNAYFLDADDRVHEQEHQKLLMDNMPCGAGIYEFKDGRISLTYQNRSYWELVGLGEEAYPDASDMSAIHPEDTAAVMNELAAAIEQKRDVSCLIRLRHLTRGYRLVRLSGRIVHRTPDSFLIYAVFTPADGE